MEGNYHEQQSYKLRFWLIAAKEQWPNLTVVSFKTMHLHIKFSCGCQNSQNSNTKLVKPYPVHSSIR